MRAGPFLLYIIGIAIFCAMDAVMKKLVETNPAVMATFWRYVAAIFFTGLIWVQAGRPRITADMLPVHLTRGVILALSAFLFFWSLTVSHSVSAMFGCPGILMPIGTLMLRMTLKTVATARRGSAVWVLSLM